MGTREANLRTRIVFPGPTDFRRRVGGVMLHAVALLVVGCDADRTRERSGPTSSTRVTSARFTEMTAELGVDVTYASGFDGTWFMPETVAGGLAVFDYDGDGDLDLYFIAGGPHADAAAPAHPNRLLRREADGRFTDVTDRSGLGDRGWGMGCAIGDIDNDGDADVFVTNYGPDRLYRNQGDGTFSDITDVSGIASDGWSASATFLDYDGDGLLDLYVTQYLHYDRARGCTDRAGAPDYCGPASFPDLSDRLFRNRGDGRFEDVSGAAGISDGRGAGLGVVSLDVNGDRRPDLFVSNDGDPNFLWIHDGEGRFTDEALLYGVALSAQGLAEAGMGVAAGDVDRDGAVDLFVTHLNREQHRIYRRGGAVGFSDDTAAVGMALGGRQFTGFGAAMFDFDLDGDLDLALANGAVQRRATPLRDDGAHWAAYAEPNQLFENRAGRWIEVSEAAGEFGQPIEESRGLIAADLDDDGDLDLVVVNVDAPARLYRNDTPPAGAWLKVRARDPELRRDAIGARVEVRVGDRSFVSFVGGTANYLSGQDPILHFGLGAVSAYDEIIVDWPHGARESFAGGSTRRTVIVRRGEGSVN